MQKYSRRFTRAIRVAVHQMPQVEPLEQRVLFSAVVQTLTSFNPYADVNPGLASANGMVYGTVNYDGSNQSGAVYTMPAIGGKLTILTSFGVPAVFRPEGGIVISGTSLYGVAETGGVYSLPISGGNPAALPGFNTGAGTHLVPYGTLAVSGNKLYGTATEDNSANSVIFSEPIAGGAPSIITTYAGTLNQGDDYPVGMFGFTDSADALVISGSTIYGIALTADGSAIFSVPIAGGSMKMLYTLPYGDQDSSALGDLGSFAISGGVIYGTAEFGGANDDGVVFSMPASGGKAQILANFDSFDQGNGFNVSPDAVAVQGTTIYGTTIFGGADDLGTVFSVPISGGDPDELAYSNKYPVTTGLVISTVSGNSRLCDTTGYNGYPGVLFSAPLNGEAPSITISGPSSQSAKAGVASSVALGSFAESNTTAPFKDTINWGDGSANTVLSLTSAGAIPATAHTFAKVGTDSVSETVTDANGVPSNTVTFPVTVSAASVTASKLAFSTAPTSGTAGKALSSIVVDVESAAGAVVTTDTSTVTLAIEYGASSTVQKTLTAKAVKGVATFSSTILDLAGSYKLKATDGSLTSATSSAFTVVAAAAAKLVFGQGPSAVVAGKAIAPAVTATVEDAFGNLVTTDKSTVKLAIASGPTGGGLTGVVTAAAVAGVTKFSDLILEKAGIYTLKATDGSLTAATSASFTVSPAAAAKLVFAAVPASAKVNSTITPAITVDIEDAFGNIVTTNATKATLSLATGPTGGAISGTTAVTAVKGVATFSALKLSKAGKHTLKVTDGSLTAAVSAVISVS